MFKKQSISICTWDSASNEAKEAKPALTIFPTKLKFAKVESSSDLRLDDKFIPLTLPHSNTCLCFFHLIPTTVIDFSI